MKEINYLNLMHCEYSFPNSGINKNAKMKKAILWHYLVCTKSAQKP